MTSPRRSSGSARISHRPSPPCAPRSGGRKASGRSNRYKNRSKAFLRQTGKYPDYIEVGTDIWHQVHDWHVQYQQPATVARSAEGRYTILLYSTQVIMRTELAAGYIGQPYDNR